MDNFDTVIRNGTVATACETMAADIGIRDGRVVALGQGLPRGRDEIDARGLLVLPGGVDAHYSALTLVAAGEVGTTVTPIAVPVGPTPVLCVWFRSWL